MVAFQAGPGRADADDALGAAQGVAPPVQGMVHGQGHGRLAGLAAPLGLPRPVVAVDIAVAETAPVTEEVTIHFAVVTVLDAADIAVALTGADVAADRALVADAGGKLQIPFAGVALGMGLVGEHPGGADFGEVAGKLVLQHALGVTAEIDIVVGAKGPQVGATGVVIVEAHTTVAGDAAVHLMGDKRAQVLVAMGALAEAVAAPVVTGHHRHVLQVAMAALLAHRAVVGMVDHQPLHHTGTEFPGFVVGDADAGAILGRGHAGHHDHALVVVLVLVLTHRALAAGPDTAHGRVPAEIGYVQAQGEAGLEQVVGAINLVAVAIHVDGCHGLTSCSRAGARQSTGSGS